MLLFIEFRDLQGCKRGFKDSARNFLKIITSKVLFFKIKIKKYFEQGIKFCDAGGKGRLK